MPFERFTEVGRVFRPRASLRSNGQIGFNHGCVKRFSMERHSHVVLFYDIENKLVGIKLTNDSQEPGASTLILHSGNGTVSARAFLEYYNLTPQKTTQYDVRRDEDSDMLVIDVAKPVKKD